MPLCTCCRNACTSKWVPSSRIVLRGRIVRLSCVGSALAHVCRWIGASPLGLSFWKFPGEHFWSAFSAVPLGDLTVPALWMARLLPHLLTRPFFASTHLSLYLQHGPFCHRETLIYLCHAAPHFFLVVFLYPNPHTYWTYSPCRLGRHRNLNPSCVITALLNYRVPRIGRHGCSLRIRCR